MSAPNDGTMENSQEEEIDEFMGMRLLSEAVTDDHEQTVPIDLALGVQLPPVPDQAVWPQVEHLFPNQQQFHEVPKERFDQYKDMVTQWPFQKMLPCDV